MAIFLPASSRSEMRISMMMVVISMVGQRGQVCDDLGHYKWVTLALSKSSIRYSTKYLR